MKTSIQFDRRDTLNSKERKKSFWPNQRKKKLRRKNMKQSQVKSFKVQRNSEGKKHWKFNYNFCLKHFVKVITVNKLQTNKDEWKKKIDKPKNRNKYQKVTKKHISIVNFFYLSEEKKQIASFFVFFFSTNIFFYFFSTKLFFAFFFSKSSFFSQNVFFSFFFSTK